MNLLRAALVSIATVQKEPVGRLVEGRVDKVMGDKLAKVDKEHVHGRLLHVLIRQSTVSDGTRGREWGTINGSPNGMHAILIPASN